MKRKKNPKVGVVVVTYNSETYIEKCLESILENDYPLLELLIVDNNSSDKTVPLVKSKFKRVGIIENDKNLGFGAANNIGIKYLLKRKSEYILLLNPDTFSSPMLIQKLLNTFLTNNKIGVAGCVITYAKNNKKIWFAGGYFNKSFCFTRHSYMNQSLNNTNVRSGKVDFITGACMMINSKIIDKVGFIPEQYFLYFEDVFFCQKINEKGFSGYLLAEPLVSHHISTSTGVKQTNEMTPLRAYFFARNPLVYIRENMKGYRKLTGFIGQFFFRFPVYTYKILKENNPRALLYYCRGIVDGSLRESSNVFLNNK